MGVYVHSKRPKVPLQDIIKIIRSAGATYSDTDPDIAIVVGGDGTFSYYGRILSIPMLFVGVPDPDPLGSKAKLAHIFIEDLARSLTDIQNYKFTVRERTMLSVSYDGNKTRDVLTDIYLERGTFSGCIRYSVSVSSEENTPQGEGGFIEYAIGNGVIISTAFGSGGYYSHPDRIKFNKNNNDKYINHFDDTRIGICHILPVFLIRKGIRQKRNRNHKATYFQYTVPFDSIIRVSLMRMADTRLYGVTYGSKGVSINVKDQIAISASNRRAKIIELEGGNKKY